MDKKTINFEDGYAVIFNGCCISVEFKGKKMPSLNVDKFGPVKPGSQAMKMLEKKDLDPADYLFADCFGEKLIRATNGVKEAIETLVESQRADMEARNAKWEKQRLENKERVFKASGFNDPVSVVIRDSDGMPLGVSVGADFADYIQPESWDDVFESEGYSVMPRAKYEALVETHRAKVAAEQAKQDDQERAEALKRQKALDEASESNEPVVFRKFMTDRCMNGNCDECSFDSAVVYAMPNGKFETKYSCCY